MGAFYNLLRMGKNPKYTEPGPEVSRKWFRNKAKEILAVNTIKVMQRNYLENKTTIRPGFMYLFNYDPKLKDELPYYDRFPLVFPIEFYGDGFLGINFHYLPLDMRARLMDALWGLANNKFYNDKTKIRLSYELLRSASKYKYFEPCIKRYLYNHVKSRFMQVPSDEWDIALFLPLESFAKKNKLFVQRESRAIINGL